MEIPWTTHDKPEPGQQAFIMASRFNLTSARHTPAFLLGAIRIRRQSLDSPGMLGVSLRAFPLRKQYWTLSAWTGEQALRQFMRAEPHGGFMRRAHPWMRDATFKFWELPAGELDAKTLWDSAKKHIEAE
ncbi:MAG TPA: hypothetical protein VKU39_14675 [Streptosporangiaceae bacterium]|nr:hypothetical protein [Streptosporangiaceae bacterium]